MASKKIGLMCGTFNPPHIGHLILAQTALQALALDKVLFLPVGDPTHKTTTTAAHHRVEMTRLAIAGNQDFELDTTDAVRPPPHYTASLLPLIQTDFPSADLWLLIGGDSLSTFPSWHQPDQLLEHCRLAVLNRPGYDPDLPHLSRSVPALATKVDWLTGPFIHLSSSWLRSQLADGIDKGTTYLLPGAVKQYAMRHQLYTHN